MKANFFLKLSAGIYFSLALLVLLVLSRWDRFQIRALDGTVVVSAIFLAIVCLLFGYWALRVGTGSFSQRRNFGIAAGFFCGGMAGLAGLGAGIIFGIPLLAALMGMPDLWKSGKNPE